MLADLHLAMRQLLYDRGRLDPDEVDVRFDMPNQQFIDSLTRPTIDLYLFDVVENTELRQTNLRTTRANGQITHRMPPRRFDLRYLVSAPTTAVEDEHVLLWRALVTLVRYQEYPVEVLPETLLGLDPAITSRVAAADDGPNLLDIWTALETPPRPALQYVVTVPLDLGFEFTSPPVLTRTARYVRHPNETGVPVEIGTHIGGVVLDSHGKRQAGVTVAVEGSAAEGVLTDADGQFVLPRVPRGKVQLRVRRTGRRGSPAADKLVTIDVPSDSYEITID